jgi:hypothetical protein
MKSAVLAASHPDFHTIESRARDQIRLDSRAAWRALFPRKRVRAGATADARFAAEAIIGSTSRRTSSSAAMRSLQSTRR